MNFLRLLSVFYQCTLSKLQKLWRVVLLYCVSNTYGFLNFTSTFRCFVIDNGFTLCRISSGLVKNSGNCRRWRWCGTLNLCARVHFVQYLTIQWYSKCRGNVINQVGLSCFGDIILKVVLTKEVNDTQLNVIFEAIKRRCYYGTNRTDKTLCCL